MNIPAARLAADLLWQQPAQDQLVQHGHSQAPPGFRMLRSQLGHHRRAAEASGLPDAVRDRAESQDILAAVRLDQLPGVARSIFTAANFLTVEVTTQDLP